MRLWVEDERVHRLGGFYVDGIRWGLQDLACCARVVESAVLGANLGMIVAVRGSIKHVVYCRMFACFIKHLRKKNMRKQVAGWEVGTLKTMIVSFLAVIELETCVPQNPLPLLNDRSMWYLK